MNILFQNYTFYVKITNNYRKNYFIKSNHKWFLVDSFSEFTIMKRKKTSTVARLSV